MADDPSIHLLERVRAGDEKAAEELFQRFTDRLIALTSTRLSEKLARRIDPEDVVQSVYRSFFVKARDGRFALQRSGDLWRLLVGITINKLKRQAELHGAARRATGREEHPGGNDGSALGLADVALAREPTPMDAAALIDQVENLLGHLEPHHRPILELKLQGYKIEEIATQQGCSERTVRRIVAEAKAWITARGEE